MEENVGRVDRALRILIGIVMIAIGIGGYAGVVSIANVLPQALTSIILVIIGLILLITGITKRCPAYSLIGIDTK